MGTTMQTVTGGLLMLQFTEEELGEIIELTEEMCTRNGWVNEIVPPAKKRMEIINRARSRPHTPSTANCPYWQYEELSGEYDCSSRYTDATVARAATLAMLDTIEAKRIKYETTLKSSTSCFDEHDRGLIEGKECFVIILREWINELRQEAQQ
jgi:hypothetical protein